MGGGDMSYCPHQKYFGGKMSTAKQINIVCN